VLCRLLLLFLLLSAFSPPLSLLPGLAMAHKRNAIDSKDNVTRTPFSVVENTFYVRKNVM